MSPNDSAQKTLLGTDGGRISPCRLTVITLVSKNNQRIIIFFKLELHSQKGWPKDAQIK
jgi:hypothetical protein